MTTRKQPFPAATDCHKLWKLKLPRNLKMFAFLFNLRLLCSFWAKNKQDYLIKATTWDVIASSVLPLQWRSCFWQKWKHCKPTAESRTPWQRQQSPQGLAQPHPKVLAAALSSLEYPMCWSWGGFLQFRVQHAHDALPKRLCGLNPHASHSA